MSHARGCGIGFVDAVYHMVQKWECMRQEMHLQFGVQGCDLGGDYQSYESISPRRCSPASCSITMKPAMECGPVSQTYTVHLQGGDCDGSVQQERVT